MLIAYFFLVAYCFMLRPKHNQERFFSSTTCFVNVSVSESSMHLFWRRNSFQWLPGKDPLPSPSLDYLCTILLRTFTTHKQWKWSNLTSPLQINKGSGNIYKLPAAHKIYAKRSDGSEVERVHLLLLVQQREFLLALLISTIVERQKDKTDSINWSCPGARIGLSSSTRHPADTLQYHSDETRESLVGSADTHTHTHYNDDHSCIVQGIRKERRRGFLNQQ